MTNWSTQLVQSMESQAATWFVGVVLALLGAFSGRLVESVKLALNRADLRSKYFEELAVDLSNLVFYVDRLSKVYYGSTWANDDDKSSIAVAYNLAMNKISAKEYVYLSWLQHYWNKSMVDAFTLTMDKIRQVDAVVIRLNEGGDQTERLKELQAASNDLRDAAHVLLVTADR